MPINNLNHRNEDIGEHPVHRTDFNALFLPPESIYPAYWRIYKCGGNIIGIKLVATQ